MDRCTDRGTKGKMVEKICLSENDRGINTSYDRTYRQEDGHIGYMSETMPVMNGPEEARFCAGCGGRILDRYFLMAADKHWHMHCLKCYECKLHLDNELTCFVREGNVYCKEDYYRRFSIKCCAKCRSGIAANEMVMRARDFVYHMTCFTCTACGKSLLPGDYFGMKDSLVYCQMDYEGMVHAEGSMTSGMIHETTSIDNMTFFTGTKRVQKGRPRKRKLATPPDVNGYSHRSMGFGPGDNDHATQEMLGQEGYLTGSQQRQKRVRTSFKHHQLRAMKSYFSLNHNPDAKDLKQLAQKTGLSKRVLQVWFQNARAKYRRHVLKQDGDKSERSETAEGELKLSDVEEKADDSKSFGDISNNSSSSMSDLSSPSLSDIQNGLMEYEQPSSSLSDLFSTTINTIN